MPRQRVKLEKPAKAKKKGVAEFRQAHDPGFIIPNKIAAALKKLGDAWEYEIDLIRSVGVSNVQLAKYRDDFEAHIVIVKGDSKRVARRVWCGTQELAAQLRELAEG